MVRFALFRKKAVSYQLVALLWCGVLSASGQTLTAYVAQGGNVPVSPYNSWASAASNIQDAVSSASGNGLIMVSNGVYAMGGVVAPGYSLTNRLMIPTNITVRSVNGPAVTTIQGASDGGSNGPAAVRCAYLTSGAVLDGFTLAGGFTHETGDVVQLTGGGGALIETGQLINCALRGNSCAGDGAGLAAFNAVITSCLIVTNNAESDYAVVGGVYLEDSVLSDCEIRENTAVGYVSAVGGFVAEGSNNIIRRCRILGNAAFVMFGQAWGGGTIAEGLMENSLVAENMAFSLAQSISGLQIGDVGLLNCTIAGNMADSQMGANVGGVWADAGWITNCIIAGNDAMINTNMPDSFNDLLYIETEISYSCSPDITNGVGNLLVNPIFVDTNNGNFYLDWASPCIETGLGTWTAADRDLDGCPRLSGSRVDMGCYEAPQGPENMLYFTNYQFSSASTSFVKIADSDSLDLTNGFTAELWFFPSMGAESNLLFAKAAVPAGTGYGLSYRQSVGDSFTFSMWGVQDYVFSGANIDYVWHHIAIVCDTDNNVTFYVNGVSNVTIAGTAPAGVGTGALQLGFLEGFEPGYKGMMDEIRFWNTVRTPEQIRDNMHRHLTGAESGLAAYYRCNQVEGDTLPDWSGQGNDGRLVHCVWNNSSAIIGNTQVAQGENARAVWSTYVPVTPSAPGGLDLVRNGLMGLGRSVFSHDGVSGVSTSEIAGISMEASRVWYNQTAPNIAYTINARFNFDQCGATQLAGHAAADYRLLYRSGPTGELAVVSTGSTVSATVVAFNGGSLRTGWYSFGLAKQDQLITFSNLVDQAIHAKVGLQATASSGLPVSFAVQSGPGLLSGGTNLSFTGTGIVTVCASQAGNQDYHSAPDVCHSLTVTNANVPPMSFGGNGISDVSVVNMDSGTWNILQNPGPVPRTEQWGWSTCWPVPCDYDGDGRTDIAVFWADSGMWYILQSSTMTVRTQQWGWASTVPVPADYDGDGRADIAVFDPDSGYWYMLYSSDQEMHSLDWGWSEVIPVPEDYDGDGRDDNAVFWPDEGMWYIRQSTDFALVTQQWGWLDTEPFPGDYDGDGKCDMAVYWPDGGIWYIHNSAGGDTEEQFGWSAVIPVPADYDGDAKTDLAVYWSSTGDWYIKYSGSGQMATTNWGGLSDRPVLLQYWLNLSSGQ